MAKVNLNYKEYILDQYEYDIKGSIKSPHKIDYVLPKDYSAFFSQRGFCPFCIIDSRKVYNKDKQATIGLDLFEAIDIWECDCGHWEAFYSFTEEHDLIDDIDSKHWEKRYVSLLGNVEDRKKEKAVKQLLNELKSNNTKVFDINPKQFEEIAQYVFSSYFQCEVEHVGQSHDGGIDLLIVNTDKPILVQVKRRTKSDKVEGVSTVRDLLGAMYIRDNYSGLIVSTAKSFSKPSEKVITNLKTENRLDYFELFDYDRFFGLLNSVNVSRKKNWEFLIL